MSGLRQRLRGAFVAFLADEYGGVRADGLWRLFAGIYQIFIGAFVTGIVTFVAIIWGIIDIIIMVIFGRNLLPMDSRPASLVAATLNWNAGQLIFATTGGGDGWFRPLPTSSTP